MSYNPNLPIIQIFSRLVQTQLPVSEDVLHGRHCLSVYDRCWLGTSRSFDRRTIRLLSGQRDNHRASAWTIETEIGERCRRERSSQGLGAARDFVELEIPATRTSARNG
jgi:hypothetical protein